jgi:NADPH-dependent 2,4-dienoyl-CoA reductase/sulfur reductase-like enzyme
MRGNNDIKSNDKGSGKKKILIVGGVAAGTSAGSKARRIDPNADIKIIQEEPVVSYGACGIPYVIEGVIDEFSELIERQADEFEKRYNIEIIENTRAVKIDVDNKQVYAETLSKNDRRNYYNNDYSSHKINSNALLRFDYDSLVIATGARPVIPNIKGIMVNKEVSNTGYYRSSTMVNGLLLLRNYSDGIYIRDWIKRENSKSCVIVGAGLIGIEMVQAFRRKGMNVTIIETADHILPSLLDKEMAEMVKQELEKNGVNLILGEELQEVVTSSSSSSQSMLSTSSPEVRYLEGIRTSKNKEIAIDLLLLGTGVRPNSEIARAAGIELGVANAIKVDEHMRTNVPDIFAAGDCATARNYIIDEDVYLPLGTTANKQGRVAGENAAGGNAKFKGIAGSVITKTFDLYIGKTGLDKQEASLYGFDPIEKEIKSITRSRYYPGKKSISIKLVADRKSHMVLGAQIVGGEGVKGRIDLVAFASLMKATINDLVNYDSCYVPPVSPVWEPMNIASSQTAKLLV